MNTFSPMGKNQLNGNQLSQFIQHHNHHFFGYDFSESGAGSHKVRRFQMNIEVFFALPVFNKGESPWICGVLVKIITDATLFFSGWFDQSKAY